MARWLRIGGDRAAALERELQRELPPGHALHGRVVRAVAQSDDEIDDVVFEVDGIRLCIVHLSWHRETDPNWPFTTFVEALPEDDTGGTD